MLISSTPMARPVQLADLGQNQQQGWWDWFFRGGPKPAPRVREAGILSTKPTAAKQRAQFESYTQGRNKVWGEEAYEAEADEDISPLAPQGSDAYSLVGLGQAAAAEANPIAQIEKTIAPPEPPRSDKGLKLLGGSLLLGAGVALLLHCRGEQPKRFNRRRNG